MSKLMIVAAVLALLGTLGCTGTGVNQASVFQQQSGEIKLSASTTETFSSVEFVIDDKDTVKDDNPSDGIEVNYNTANLDDGIHYVKAYGITADGQRVEILDNSILINNGNGGDSGASGENGASGTTPADAGTQYRNTVSRRK